MEYTLKLSEFCRRKYSSQKPDIHLENSSSLNLTTKNELLNDQQEYPHFGSNLCIDLEQIQRIHKTSGATNAPLLIVLSHYDVEKNHIYKCEMLYPYWSQTM